MLGNQALDFIGKEAPALRQVQIGLLYGGVFCGLGGRMTFSGTSAEKIDTRFQHTVFAVASFGATAKAGIWFPTIAGYSTVTDLARLRGWSTSVPMMTAV